MSLFSGEIRVSGRFELHLSDLGEAFVYVTFNRRNNSMGGFFAKWGAEEFVKNVVCKRGRVFGGLF